MESNKEIRSSVITRSMRLHREKMRVIEKQNHQPIQNWSSSKSNSGGFKVIPTKELYRVYLQKKPDFLASKGVIDAQATPPHQKKGLKSKIHGELANHRKFCRRFDQQNMSHHHTSVDHLKENSPRCFSPLGFGSASQLRDKKKLQYIITFEKKPKEMNELCDSTNKDRVVREVGSKLMVSTCRESESALSFERNRVKADVEFRDISSSGFVSKDENNASPSGCQANSEEAHQPSPVSVLEPMFDDDVLDDCDEISDLDLHGLEKQIDTLKSESDSYSDGSGSGMEVSSDEEESVIDSETKESKESEPIGLLDTQENRDSSYVDDILAQVLLGDKNWVSDERDLAITLKIFEKLEKKYYTETSWKRSERRMLFDRVNSGLVEILESFTATPTWKKPVSRRLGIVLTTCGLKQELWKVLDRQEKRAKKESLAKVPVIDIDDWLELEADDESVVCELESMLVDELLDEVVSFM